MAAWIDALACQALEGDEAAWKKLFALLTPRLWGLFRHLGSSPSDVEDLIQETWVRVFQHRAECARGRSFEAYLFTIAVRLWIDFHRKESRLPAFQQLPDDSPSASPMPIDILFAVERADLVRHCLESLSDEEKTILVLRFWHGLTNRRIGERLGSSEASIRSRGYRALRKLADCMNLRSRGQDPRPMRERSADSNGGLSQGVASQPEWER